MFTIGVNIHACPNSWIMILIHPFTQICSPLAPVCWALFWRHNEGHHTVPVLKEDVASILSAFIFCAFQLLSLPFASRGSLLWSKQPRRQETNAST